MPDKQQQPDEAGRLRRRAEEQLKKRHSVDTDAPRLLHELQVHQIELELQNAELREARIHMQLLVDKYTDLYNFAPVGFFTIDDSDRILEANFTGIGLLGLQRSMVVQRQFCNFVIPSMRAVYRTFLKAVFDEPAKPTCEVALSRADGTSMWVDLQGNEATSLKDSQRFCRLAVSDITPFKRAEEAQSRVEELAQANQELQSEIERRRAVEASLRESEQEQLSLLEQARQMQQQLRQLSHMILNSQEEERRRISLELHDEIAQTLVGINVHLSTLANDPSMQGSGALEKIAGVQRLVENSVSQVHQFAMKLRPPILDDLGLVPALQSHIRDFIKQTNIQVDFKYGSGLEQLGKDRCTILYRVAQEALTNVGRHAQASQVEVRIRMIRKTIQMEIHDNGKSFEVERELLGRKVHRIGVIGMRERMEMVGGSFQIASAPGKGTTVSVSMPLKRSVGKGRMTI